MIPAFGCLTPCASCRLPRDTKSTGNKGKNGHLGLHQTSVHLRKQPAECKGNLLDGRKYLQTMYLRRGYYPEYSSCFPFAVTHHERDAKAYGGGAGGQLGDEAPSVSLEGENPRLTIIQDPALTSQEGYGLHS